jgi:hypothetical protein
MKRTICWFKNHFLRQALTVFLVGITAFVMQGFAFTNAQLAQAEPVTPEATSYQVDNGDRDRLRNDNKLVERSRNNLKDTADNVREKLNLDEPIEGTKDFLKSTQKKVEETVKPLTSNEQGTYQNR